MLDLDPFPRPASAEPRRAPCPSRPTGRLPRLGLPRLGLLQFGLLVLAPFWLAACGAPVVVHAAPSGWTAYGAGVPPEQPLSLESLLAQPERYVGQTLVLEAEVDECCQEKGCWMTLTHAGQTVRVTFKDYGFFVPRDTPGRTVRLQGVFEQRLVPESQQKHWLEDAGRPEEAAAVHGDTRTYVIVASGVLIRS